MKLWIKLALCLLLMLFAAASLLAVLDDLGLVGREDVLPEQDAGYALRDWQGRLAVFSPPGADTPAQVTDVRVRMLPLTDRLALRRGVAAADRESLARLLEDLSS